MERNGASEAVEPHPIKLTPDHENSVGPSLKAHVPYSQCLENTPTDIGNGGPAMSLTTQASSAPPRNICRMFPFFLRLYSSAVPLNFGAT